MALWISLLIIVILLIWIIFLLQDIRQELKNSRDFFGRWMKSFEETFNVFHRQLKEIEQNSETIK